MSSDRTLVVRLGHLPDPTEAEIDAVVSLAVRALAVDPFSQTALDGKHTDTRLLYRLLHAFVVATVADGELWVAEQVLGGVGESTDIRTPDSDTKLAGIACWFPPGRLLDPSKTGLAPLIADLPDGMSAWWADYARASAVQTDAALGADVKRDNYHLSVLAVHTACQGAGVGRRLVMHIAERAFRERKRVCWETTNEHNVPKYVKWGASVLGSEKYEGVHTPGFTRWILEMPWPAD